MDTNNVNTPENDAVDQHKKAVQKDAAGLWKSLKRFLVDLFDFRYDTDRANTIEAIKTDIPYRGATAWILACSIFVASVGLNANSTAVVIGAMLISPLMGPILGIGMSIAINDIDTLKKSLINFAVMVVISVITAYLFFYFFPLREESSELLNRTRPDIRDVLIAFFGGLALIIARTKKGTIATVIFGVAIATALMPPLCTVGFGLAEATLGNTKGFGYAGGAMYLFMINSIFIALATFLVLKLLRFPMIKYANSVRRKNVARIASFFALLVMIPAGITFYRVLKESTFKNSARRFIEKELDALPNADYIKRYATFTYNHRGISKIELTPYGDDMIEASTIDVLQSRFNDKDYRALKDSDLSVRPTGSSSDFEDEIRYMEAIRSRDSLDLMTKNQKIRYLEEEVAKLSRLKNDIIPFQELCDEARINYSNLDSLSYSVILRSNFDRLDTISVFTTKWNDTIDQNVIIKDKARLYKWLKFKLNRDTVMVNDITAPRSEAP